MNFVQKNMEHNKLNDEESCSSNLNKDQIQIEFSEQEINDLFKNSNIVKNILKQYYKFLTKETNASLVQEFIVEKPIKYSIKLIKKFFKDINYNNQLLVKVIKHEKYGKGFEYYLTFDALEELQNSKVQNISEHILLIDFLKQCCANHQLVNNINFYKKKQKYNV